jgi:hypothetical protein
MRCAGVVSGVMTVLKLLLDTGVDYLQVRGCMPACEDRGCG